VRKKIAMRSSFTTIAACLVVCHSAGTAWAKDQDIYDMSLDELAALVITDTKVGQNQDKVTQKVDMLYPKEFEQQTTFHRNISELLMYTAGQFVNLLSRNDANWGSFGGLGPKYNGYLLDGLPVDSFADGMSLDPWAFAHVEIHKGPASVMYSNYLTMDFAGNETPLAGTTNFVLKDWIDAPVTRLMLGGGSYNTLVGRIYHQDRKGNLNYFFGTSLEQSDYTNYGAADSWLNMVDDPGYQKTKVYGKLTYLFNRDDHKISLFANHTQHTGDAGRPNRDFAHRYDTINAAYSNQIIARLHLQLKAGFRNYNRRWAEDNFPTDLALREHDGVRQRIVPADVTINIAHRGDSLLTAGADSQFATYESYAETAGIPSTNTRVFAYSIGAFIQEKLVVNRWVFRVGGRFNHTGHTYKLFAGVAPGKDNNTWNIPLWSVGIRNNLTTRVAIYANAGSSFVAPSAKQLGGTLSASSAGLAGANGQLPNLDLQPEKGVSTDLGFDLHPLDSMSIGVRTSYSQINEAIVDNVVSTTPSQTQSMNVGKARSLGFELSIEHRLMAALRWFANANYATTRVSHALDDDQNGAMIPFVPDFTANAGLSAKFPLDIQLSPYFRLVGHYFDSTAKSSRRRFGPYPVLNLRAQKSFITNDSFAVRAVLDLNNILNRRYALPWQFQEPGFNAFGSLELTL
jgi:iron complex outermembrane recepter protein